MDFYSKMYLNAMLKYFFEFQFPINGCPFLMTRPVDWPGNFKLMRIRENATDTSV